MTRPELLVVGAGPAGLAAAAEATAHGVYTMLVDSRVVGGGQYYARPTGGWLEGLPVALTAGLRPDYLDLRLGAEIWAAFEGPALALTSAAGAEMVRPTTVVVATGAREVALPFPGWELPGVLTAGAAQLLLKESGVALEGRVVVAGSGPFLLPVAAGLVAAGARVQAIVEAQPARALAPLLPALAMAPDRLHEAAGYARRLWRTPRHLGTTVRRYQPGIVELSSGERLGCDALCVGYGFVPRLELAMLLGCQLGPTGVRVDGAMRTSVASVFAAGEVTGIGGAPLAALEGRIAGLAVARQLGRWRPDSAARLATGRRERARLATFARQLWAAYPPLAPLALASAPDTMICRCEGVTLGALRDATTHWGPLEGRKGAKALLRCGMGACQGAMCAEAVRAALGGPAAEWAEPLPRPPLGSISVGAVASLTDPDEPDEA